MAIQHVENTHDSITRKRPYWPWVKYLVALIVVALISAGAAINPASSDRCPPECDYVSAAGDETFTPTPIDALTPTFAETTTPTATYTLTPTPTPTWLARITYPKLTPYAPVTRFVDLIGEYRADMTGDIWVWVQDPNGLYYPASMDPCNGQSTPKVNGKWEIFVGVGVDASSGVFNLVLTTTTPDASVFIAGALKGGCETGIFPGFETLPPGTTEIERVKVLRQPVTGPATLYPKPPLLPDARLPGYITVDPFGSNGTVGVEEYITGTLYGGADSVWALVYTFYGRWYPQSFSPCDGIHTEKIDDNHWRAKAIFGNDQDGGKPFSAVIVLANPQANAFFDAKQREFCAANDYPGFLTIELPDGLSLKSSTRVIRR